MKRYSVRYLGGLGGVVRLPASKSVSNRALIVGALAGGGVTPLNVSDCDDTRVMVRALSGSGDGCGCGSDVGSGVGLGEGEVVDIMGAGTAMRFLTAYFSVTEGERVLTGTERMRHRPIGVLVDALRALGADIEYVGEEGFPPLRVRGKRLKGGDLELPGGVSSQYISALMMIAPALEKGLRLTLTGGVVSRPYIDLTMRVMRAYGGSVEWEEENVVRVNAGGYAAVPYMIENDWSAASYWYEIVALAASTAGDAEVRLPGLFADSGQGDQEVMRIFERLGVETRFEEDGVALRGAGRRVERLEMDFVKQPDLAQTVVVTCCLLGVKFRFTGLQSLRIKETDRIAALETELRKWGYVVHDAEDSVMWWDGEMCDEASGAAIDTYDDHRMAMAFAPGSIVRGETVVNEPGVVSKSYPGFWDDMRSMGFVIKEV